MFLMRIYVTHYDYFKRAFALVSLAYPRKKDVENCVAV